MDGITIPTEAPYARSVYHLYVVRTANRDALQAHLSARGIATGLHYPLVLHRQNAYRDLGYENGAFPVAERISSELLSLPMYPQLEDAQLERVARSVADFCRAG
jgi:dTDP-4-amino-4,6-dideoxygalactose transaminase